MIKAIIFDCFGVLTKDLWHEFTMSLPADQAERARELNRAYDAALISKETFLQQVQEVTGRSSEAINQLLDVEVHKNTELLNYIRKLKPTYKIGLLSNVGTSWIRDTFLTDSELTLFDDMIFSFEVGITKPDPRIFDLTAQRLDARAEECVLVDDIDRYCAAARGIGMQTIVYNNFAQMRTALEQLLANTNN
jgi:putative hydrolase of the HAD superfamily